MSSCDLLCREKNPSKRRHRSATWSSRPEGLNSERLRNPRTNSKFESFSFYMVHMAAKWTFWLEPSIPFKTQNVNFVVSAWAAEEEDVTRPPSPRARGSAVERHGQWRRNRPSTSTYFEPSQAGQQKKSCRTISGLERRGQPLVLFGVPFCSIQTSLLHMMCLRSHKAPALHKTVQYVVTAFLGPKLSKKKGYPPGKPATPSQPQNGAANASKQKKPHGMQGARSRLQWLRRSQSCDKPSRNF